MIPELCSVCGGKGWYETGQVLPSRVEPCTNCHRGWVSGEARWVCDLRTDWNTCNPGRMGMGHVGCGWFVPMERESVAVGIYWPGQEENDE